MTANQVKLPNGTPKNLSDEPRRTDAPTSGFTAVNGHSPTSPGTSKSGRDDPVRRSAQKSTAVETPSTSETSVSPKMADRDWRRRPNGTSQSSAGDFRPAQHDVVLLSPVDDSRKRSLSASRDGDTPDSASSGQQSKQRRMETDSSRARNGYHPASNPDLPPPSNQMDFRPANLSGYRENHEQTHRTEQPESPGSDAHMAAALQRENQAMEQNQQQGQHATPPEGHHPSLHHHHHFHQSSQSPTQPGSANSQSVQSGTPKTNGSAPYSETPQGIVTIPAQRTKSGERPPVVQIEKKRKRIFSNRTKSGCLTCRSRKKKCDEAKPECNNCLRGGFQCAGYSQKGPWSKPPFLPKPATLQSKDGTYTAAEPSPQPPPPQGYYREPIQSQAVDGARQRPVLVEEEHSHAPGPPPSRGSMSYPQQAQQPPAEASGHHFYPPEPTAHHDYPRPASSMHEMRDFPPHASASQPAVTAQLALQHPAVRAPHKSEREKMLQGEPFLPNTGMLADDRETCKAALGRFNQNMNPNSGISREERQRLFRLAIEGSSSPHVSGPRDQDGRALRGTVGRDVVVEAPFTCDYGYNLHIGDEVSIGANCTILDPCWISIGAQTIIGPNVNIYGLAVSIDPRMRQGSRGQAVGNRVIIGENCWIGGNVTILPKVVIGKGATVGAGSVVTRNVPEYTVVVGNPAKVVRGIWLGMSSERAV